MTDEPTPRVAGPLALLTEWYAWWFDNDAAPAKMPAALHIRTAMVLWDERLLDGSGRVRVRPETGATK